MGGQQSSRVDRGESVVCAKVEGLARKKVDTGLSKRAGEKIRRQLMQDGDKLFGRRLHGQSYRLYSVQRDILL